MPETPNRLLKGSILKAIVALAVPIVFANVLQTLYQLIDTFWVGRLGENAVAAVSLSFPVLFLIISLGGGLAISGTILVAQFKGANNRPMVNHVSAQTFSMMILISIILSLIGYFFSPHLIHLLSTDPAVAPDAINYLRISFLGLIFMFTYFVFQSLMRGIGEVKIPLYLVLGTVILNFFLDPLLIMGYGPFPRLEVSGAALATITSQGLAAIIGLIILFQGQYGIHLKKLSLKPDFKWFKKIFYLGLPASVEQSLRAFGMLLMTFLVSGFGTTKIAAYGLGTRMLSFIIIPSIGLSIAISTLIGQNLGAGQKERAEKTARIGIGLAFSILTLLGILLFTFAQSLASWFVPGETNVISESALFIRTMALTFGFIGLQMIIIGAFRGSGSTVIAMILSTAHLFILLSLACLLCFYTNLGTRGIWWAYPLANILAASIAVIWFSKGTWKDKKLIGDEKIVEKIMEETDVEKGL